jgi:hypothetical protein
MLKLVPPENSKACYNDLKNSVAKEKKTEFVETANKTDNKIKDLALEKFARQYFGLICGHLVTKDHSRLVLGMFPELFNKTSEKNNLLRFEKKKAPFVFDKKRFVNEKVFPIGINTNTYNNWINALLQFVIFIPSLRGMFDFTPSSLLPFCFFIDRYLYDSFNNKFITNANSEKVIECLYEIFSENSILKKTSKVDIYQVLLLIMNLLYDSTSFSYTIDNVHLLSCHPEYQLVLEEECRYSLEMLVKDYIFSFKKQIPSELLINFDFFFKKRIKVSRDRKIPRQVFFYSKEPVYYDLDAFIEYRKDDGFLDSYITYVKVEGVWFQCFDERITPLRSNFLEVPLRRSFLFHYKKILCNKKSLTNFC